MRTAASSSSSSFSASRLLGWALAALGALAWAWLVFRIHLAGEPVWAVAAGVGGMVTGTIYLSPKTLAARYLFPGVAGMLLFVALPLVLTVRIGFTNYSATHLLSEERARAYLLAQTQVDEAHLQRFTLHAEGAQHRLVLTGPDGVARWQTPALSLGAAQSVTLEPRAEGAALPSAALPLREQIAQRDGLMALSLQAPGSDDVWRYAGVGEFAPLRPLWVAHSDGSLTRQADGVQFAVNRDEGFFEHASSGERISPAFKVDVGWANYTRMLGDPDFRGPFVQIFIWTVVFSALTVLFATALGMTLAVALNWEALAHRTLYRTLLFLPYAVPGFISILVFKGLFNQNFGEINAVLDALFGIRPAWFSDPFLAKAMLLIVNTWLGYPYIMILCTGLLKSIPADLYEASALAGVGPLTNFFKITLPLVIKPLTPLLVSAFAFNFNNFVLIALLTNGSPDILNSKLPAGTNDILVSYTYRIAFSDAGANFGLAAAISTMIFIIVAAMALINLRLTKKFS